MSMKFKRDLIIKQNKLIANNIYELILTGDDFSSYKAGQFVNISIDGFYLRRPISICNCDSEQLILTYKVVGDGTSRLSKYSVGDSLNLLSPLGNGFNLNNLEHKKVTLIGGGIGVPPLVKLYTLLKEIANLEIKVILGFNSEAELIYEDVFSDATVIYGKDTCFNYLDESDTYIFSCGPLAMLEALSGKYDGQFLLEERMGCGFGACMGCSRKISELDYKRVCVEGPVFTSAEVNYESRS